MKKAFTLVELLIASAIFIVVMMIVTATFGWASTYNSKLQQMRMVSQDGRRITEMVSKDVRLANGSIKGLKMAAGSTTSYDIGELTFLYCPTNSFSNCAINSASSGQIPARYMTDAGGDPSDASATANSNTLLVLQQDQGKVLIYRAIKDPGSANYVFVLRQTGSSDAPSALFSSRVLQDVFNSPFLDGDDLSTASAQPGWTMLSTQGVKGDSFEIAFAGYGPNRSNRNQQPYCEFGLRAQSWNYDSIDQIYRAQLDLKTTVETRDYN